MEKLMLRFAAAGFWMQALAAFVVLSVFSLASGGYATLEPSFASFALYFGPLLLLGLIFAAFFKLLLRFQQK